MQRPTDSCSTSMRQPCPAMRRPPMMQSSGTNTSTPWIGPFWNGMLSGRCRRPIVDARRVARNQRAGDAEVRRVAQQLVRIEHAERQADHGRDRRQRDVALGEIEPEADDLARPARCRGRRRRCRESMPRPSRRADRSAQSRGPPRRAPAAAGSIPSAPRCRSATAARPVPASSARRPSRTQVDTAAGEPSRARRNARRPRIPVRRSASG